MIESGLTMPFGTTPEEVRSNIRQLGLEPQGGHLPTGQEMTEGVEKKIPSLKPETEGEEQYERGLESFVSLLMPGAERSALNTVLRAAAGAGGGEAGAEAMKKLGFGEGAQNAVRFGVGALSQMVQRRPMGVREGRIRMAGERAGLTAEELAPITHTEGGARRLGRMTTETEANRGILRSIEHKTNQFLDNIRERATNTHILPEHTEGLLQDARALRRQVATALGEEPQREAVVRYLDTVINDLERGNITGAHLVTTYRDINRVFRDNIPHQMNLLQRVNRSISNTLSRADPALGRDFRLGNRLYRARMEFMDHVGWQTLERAQTHGNPAQRALTDILVGGVGGGLVGHPEAGAAAVAVGDWAMNRVANWLLTSPAAVGVRRITMQALRENNPKLALTAYNSLRDRVKNELPEEFNAIDWELSNPPEKEKTKASKPYLQKQLKTK
jgi:hypothetical protein